VRQPRSAGPPAGRLSPGQTVTLAMELQEGSCDCFQDSVLEELLPPAAWSSRGSPHRFSPNPAAYASATSHSHSHSHSHLSPCARRLQLLQLSARALRWGRQLISEAWRWLCKPNGSPADLAILRRLQLEAELDRGAIADLERRPGPVQWPLRRFGATGEAVSQDSGCQRRAPPGRSSSISMGWLLGLARSAGALRAPASARWTRRCCSWSAELGCALTQLTPPTARWPAPGLAAWPGA